MNKVFSLLVGGVAAVAALAWLASPAALAVPEFRKEFENKYVPENPSTPEQKALKSDFEAAKCGVCHPGPQGKEKKQRNAYGAELGKLIKKADKKAVDKIQDALDKVAKEHSDPNDPKSKTFGELIKEGKLPVSQDNNIAVKAE